MSDVDPRYDPRYQRGFDAARDATPAPSNRRDNPALRSPIETSPAPVELHSDARMPGAGPIPALEAPPQDPDGDAEREDRRRRDARVARAGMTAILALSLVLIAASGVLLAVLVQIQIASSASNATSAPARDYASTLWVQTLGYSLAPSAFTVGVLGIVIWVALIVVRRRG